MNNIVVLLVVLAEIYNTANTYVQHPKKEYYYNYVQFIIIFNYIFLPVSQVQEVDSKMKKKSSNLTK